MGSKVKCTCGWSWNKSDSSKKDMYICHECGRDNSNNMKNGGWLDNYNDYKVSAPEGMVGDGFSNVGRNYSPAWGGQFEDGGSVYPVNHVPEAQWGLPVGPLTPIAPLAISAANKVKSWFSDDDEQVKPIKKPVAKGKPRTLNIVDPRKKMATTNQPLRPNSDLVGGKYNSKHLDKLMQEAKRQGLSKQDIINLSAMGFQETKWGRSDGNIGHVLGDWGGHDSYSDFVNAYKAKMKEADRLGIKDPALRLQVYNGMGTVTPKTEKDYHGFEMQKIYGVPIPKEGINMKKNPLYGKQVMDIRDNVLAKNPEYVQYMDSIYKAPVPEYMEDVRMNKQKLPKNIQGRPQLAHQILTPLKKKEMGGSIPGTPGFTYARTNDPAPDNGPGAKKTLPSAQNGHEMSFYQNGLDWTPKNISKNGSVIKDDRWKRDVTPVYQQGGYIPKAQSGIKQSKLDDIYQNDLAKQKFEKFGEFRDTLEGTDEVMYGTPEYEKAYKEGRFADVPNQLDEITISPYTKQFPYYEQLTPNEKKHLRKNINSNDPITRQLKARAVDGRGFDADKAKDFAMAYMRDIPLATLGAPQSALVEGIEAIRGNEYNPLNAITPGSQRVPSETFLKDASPGWQLAGDMLIDVPLVGSAANAARKPIQKGLQQTGKYLTEETALRNAYKLNPYAFKPNPEAYYRKIGDEGLKDATESGFIRANPKPTMIVNHPDKGLISIQHDTPTFDKPYFSKGQPWEAYQGKYMAEVKELPMTPRAAYPETAYVPENNITINNPNLKLYKKDWLKGYEEVPKPTSSVDDVSRGVTNTPKPWQMQELPGLHLKSTMEGEAISKIIEPKTGLINTEQALAIIGKESGGADKVALIRQGLGDNIPKKMDYNEFRKLVQEQLIPLERQFATDSSGYGINRLGYNTPTRGGFNNRYVIKEAEAPIENQTLILGNKSKFGRGSSVHGNPEETLGHIHFLRDAETPDVLTVTQIQSDAFQGTHRIMPKVFNKEKEKEVLEAMLRIEKLQEETAKSARQIDSDTFEYPDGLRVSKSVIENMGKAQKEFNIMQKAHIENFTQKQLLDKNHQERYLQELVDYAGKRGDINKVRVPTSETAAKVQGYEKVELDYKNHKDFEFIDKNINKAIDENNTELKFQMLDLYQKMKKENPEKYFGYNKEHQTILKKYSEQPKTIKKLFGQEPKTVTDGKGNTWYEFDIPDKFKKGKGEIKAFSTLGAISTATAATQLGQKEPPQYQQGGIIKDNNGYWNLDNWGKPVEIDSNQITMKGVNQPLLGVSDTGDIKLMKPGKNYKFKGKKVTEFPMAKNGIRQEQKGLVNLNQLTNFTNYNKPTVGGWLNKYSS
jgi:hypothetical protein